MNHHQRHPLGKVESPQSRHVRHRLFLAHPTRFERATVALEACDAPKPVPVWPLPSPGQSDELTHLRLAENVSSAFASMQSNDAVDGVQFGWLD
jgi:hypothetical protein